MKYSFTGSREALSYDELALIVDVCESLEDGTEFNSGAQYGVDTFVAMVIADLYPDAIRRIIVPDAYHNPDALKYGTPVHLEKKADNDAAAYGERNKALVALCGCLIAFPKTPTEKFRGSGTWWTIRMAREANREIRIYPLSLAEK